MSRPAFAAAALVVLTACGGTAEPTSPRVNNEHVETLLVQRQRERNPRLRVADAICPADVEARQGETFQCTVDIEGQRAWFSVTISEILGRQARYDFQPDQAVIDVAAVADFVRSRLEQDWRTAAVDCGQGKVRLMDVGAVLACTASNGATTRHIEALVEDRDGTVSVRER